MRQPTCAFKPGDSFPHVNISADLVRFYFQVQHPALAGRPYSGAIADFTDRAILAYECGYSEVDLKVQLEHALLAGGSGLTFAHAKNLDMADCLVCISLVWLTLMASPKGGTTRWSTAEAVSEKTGRQWRGFVAMIVTAYFEQRMAWYPIDRLCTEVALSSDGEAEAPDLVAERARLVFTTLERVHPQFPSM